ncbi:MAG: GNAT family N-acetyltransferase [Candidatus Hermodarchaeota archaeon]
MIDSNHSNYLIRKAEIKDLITIEELLRETGWFDHINNETPQQTLFQLQLKFKNLQKDPSQEIFIAEKNGKAEGYIIIHWMTYFILPGPEGYISDLFVKENERGQGIGSALLNKVKKEAQKKHCYRLNLLNNRNRISYLKGFYKKNGFEERDKMANFIQILF